MGVGGLEEAAKSGGSTGSRSHSGNDQTSLSRVPSLWDRAVLRKLRTGYHEDKQSLALKCQTYSGRIL